MTRHDETISPYALAPLRGSRPPAPAWFESAVSAPFEQIAFEWEGVALELLSWGEIGKPGLLLLHGNNAHARWWSPIAAQLAGEYRVAALSWSGMGGSGWRSSYSVAGYAREAMAAAQASGLMATSRPILVGHSFGGSGALEAALRYGDELAGVILVDSLLNAAAGKPGLPPRAAHRIYPSEGAALARFRLAPPQPCANLYYMDWVARHALRAVDGGDQGESGWTWRIDPALWENLEWHDKWHAFTQGKCPLALIRGGSSRIVTPDQFDILKGSAPLGTHFDTIADAGHHVLLDQPLQLVEAIGRIARQLR